MTCFREVHRKKPLDLTHSRFEKNRSRTTRFRVLQSFAFKDEAMCYLHTHRHNTPTDRPTHHHSPLLPPLSLPHAHANAHVHARVFVYVCICICKCVCTCTCICVSVSVCVCVCVCAYVYVYESVRVCAREYVYDLPQWFHVFLLHFLQINTSYMNIYIYIYIC